VGPERGGEIAEPRAVHVVDGHLRRADDDVAESREPSREHGLREAAERLLESPGCAKGRSADRETAQRSVPPVTEVGMRSQTSSGCILEPSEKQIPLHSKIPPG
jgi:hypothetical protein